MARRPLSRRATISMGAKWRSACFRSRGSKTIRIGCAIRLEVAIIVSGLIRRREREKKIFGRKTTYLAFGTLAGGFDPIATFDDIGFQAYRTRSTVEFQE